MEHLSRNAVISIGDHTFTELDYTGDAALSLNHPRSVRRSTEVDRAAVGKVGSPRLMA